MQNLRLCTKTLCFIWLSRNSFVDIRNYRSLALSHWYTHPQFLIVTLFHTFASTSGSQMGWWAHICWYTVYPKKYAHGFCFAVLCCGYTLTDFPISIRLTSLALWQSNDCASASKATLMNMDKYFMWIHYERLHNHNKAKHNKTVCIFLGIYCIWRAGIVCQTSGCALTVKPISRTKFQNLNVSYILTQLSSLNSLTSGVKLRMKMLLEQRRQAMLQLHLSYQQFYCLLRCDLY